MGDSIPAEGGALFTRGGPNMPDTRGKSMVAVHLDKLQKEKEEHGMEKLRLLMPQLSAATHAVALQECNWEEDKAVAMLRLFVAKKAGELKILNKEKKRHQKKLIEKMQKAAQESSDKNSGSDSSGSDSSSGESGSESDYSSEDNRRSRGHRRKDSSSKKRSRSSKDRHSRKKRSRKEKDSKKRSKRSSSRRRREKDQKKDRKEKRERRSSKSRRSKDKEDKGKVLGTEEYEYGKYGVIRETDYYTKRSEFMLWALEIKKSDVEAMSRFEEKELFKSYMEDYNTATLPHKKFYDLEAWEKEAAATGGGGGGGGERMIFNDEAERKKELLAERQREHAERLRAAYEELQTTDKAQAMREQELLRSKMGLAYRLGDQKEAARLAERLKPDEPK